MKAMDLYKSIFYRRSVRKYRMENLETKTLEDIKKFLDHQECLYPALPIVTEIKSNEKFGKYLDTNFLTAPYYLEAKAGSTEEDYLNLGFCVEQVSLYLTGRGLGSCFIGGKEALLLAFGKAADTRADKCKNFLSGSISDPVKREPEKAKRQKLNYLCTYKETPVKEISDLLEAARLAPSAWNGQPWRFVVYRNRIHIFCKKSKKIIKHKKEKYIGIGAMLSHIFLTAEELWLEMDVKTLDQMTEKTYQNHEYVISVILK